MAEKGGQLNLQHIETHIHPESKVLQRSSKEDWQGPRALNPAVDSNMKRKGYQKSHVKETRNITGRVELFFPDLLWYFEAA
jgi:hypothetical protein